MTLLLLYSRIYLYLNEIRFIIDEFSDINWINWLKLNNDIIVFVSELILQMDWTKLN